ncbi:MAG: response regulator [Rhodospirillaceae bacterium]|jgi:two-component system CheB/CheR fusion protein|nr:response regulator [Rhodospirillaceae bacterium]MBT4587726.1 response regulator [Rhodospirillaceae bacterium]MBT5940721.1 response regulator [Rhodospirillaceae bacterium]MBT7267054.1 response regulator [Rhodospirillaceae bacterium]
MTRIVAIDDEPAILQAMGDYLEHFGFDVSTHAYVGSNADGFTKFCQELPEQPDIIIVDYRLPGDQNGTQIVDDMRTAYDKKIPAILFTGDISKKTIGDAEARDLHLLYKPVRMEVLRQTVEEILGGEAD